jgi:hypothetical protein
MQTTALNEKHGKQKTLSLKSLLALNPKECSFADLNRTIMRTATESSNSVIDIPSKPLNTDMG